MADGTGASRAGGGRTRVPQQCNTQQEQSNNLDQTEEDGGADHGAIFSFDKMSRDKVNWTERNTYTFCELWVEQIDEGQCFKCQMKKSGFIALAQKFYLQTGLKHDSGQFKNRKDQLKAFFQFWCEIQKRTGLGRHPDGSVAASHAWWKKKLEGKPAEFRKVEFGNPEYLDLMKIMFKDVMVDGSTSYVPGQEEPAEEEEVEDEDEEEDKEEEETTPKTTGSRKRNNSSTATSPSRKIKSPMVRVLRELVNKWTSQDQETQKALIEAQKDIAAKKIQAQKEFEKKIEARKEQHIMQNTMMVESVKTCQQLALACGVAPGSVEFFACREIFKDSYERTWFCEIPTAEARLQFIQRYCQQNKFYN
ncbi:unnamed protein product [Urochloa humidicola]